MHCPAGFNLNRKKHRESTLISRMTCCLSILDARQQVHSAPVFCRYVTAKRLNMNSPGWQSGEYGCERLPNREAVECALQATWRSYLISILPSLRSACLANPFFLPPRLVIAENCSYAGLSAYPPLAVFTYSLFKFF